MKAHCTKVLVDGGTVATHHQLAYVDQTVSCYIAQELNSSYISSWFGFL